MKLELNPRLLTDIIGKGQYTQFRSVIAEYVANAWDAEANYIKIELPEDFTNNPIVIQDNGKGVVVEKFSRVGFNQKSDYSVTLDYRRPLMGMKGIGRFAGFALAEKIKYISNNGLEEIECIFERKHLLEFKDITEVDIPFKKREPLDDNIGTIVELSIIDQQYKIPTPEQVIRDLLLDFGAVKDFQIEVNGELCKYDKVEGNIIEIDETNSIFGHVSGNIIISKAKSKKLDPGIIIRVNARRVEGPTLFNIDKDVSSKIINRIYGDINADGLEDIITSGREAFIQHDERYENLVYFIKNKLSETIDKYIDDPEESIEDIIYNIDRFKKRLDSSPQHIRDICQRYIKKISPRLARVRHDRGLLEIIALLILRASENADMYTILNELEKTENTDINGLSKVLSHWGFGEIVHATSMIQHRLKILTHFSKIINDKNTLELQELHRVLENNIWIIDDKYSLFTSNQSLNTIAKKLGKEYAGEYPRKRPDLILKRDRNDIILIELKAPNVEVKMIEVTQALEYRTELKKLCPDVRDIHVFLIGKDYDETSRDNFKAGNNQNVNLLSLDSLSQDAEARLRWLAEAFELQYLEFKNQYDYDLKKVEAL